MNWSSILGTGDTIKKGMDLIDDAFYSDQERADQKSKLLESFHPFKRAQRILSIYIYRMFAPLFAIEVVLGLCGAYYPKAWEIAAVLNSMEAVQIVTWSFLAVNSLYFTGGIINSFTSRIKNA